MNPINQLTIWIEEERQKGAEDPQHAVLSTVSGNAIPHARVVSIREINEKGLLFFTQKRTRKVTELEKTPIAAITFWFELYQREVIIEGKVEMLDRSEKEQYWQTIPHERQVRFCTTASQSTLPIVSKEAIEEERIKIRNQFQGKIIPMPACYSGFRLKPMRFVFYSYQKETLSDVVEYCQVGSCWQSQLLSP